MSKFSRPPLDKLYETLSLIVDTYQCRFISLYEGIDSQDSAKWHITMSVLAHIVYLDRWSERDKAEYMQRIRRTRIKIRKNTRRSPKERP